MRKFCPKKFMQKLTQKLHPSWCFYAWVWSVIIGIIFGVIFEQTLNLNVGLLIFTTIIMALSWRFSCGIVIIVSILSGFLLGNYRAEVQISGREIITAYINQTVTLRGNISEDPDNSKGNTVIRMRDLCLQLSSEEICFPGTAYISLSSKEAVERSDTVTLNGKLGSGFGTFVMSMYRAELTGIERSDTGDIFARFKRWFAARASELIPSPEVDLGLGYLMGMKSGMSEDFTTALQMVGMTHVVVASGAHLAILTGAAKKIFGRISKFAGIMFSLLMILIFVLIVGFTPSMTRAALVASLSLIVGYVGRKFTPLRLIGFVAMLTLLIDPVNLLNLGWQLSFASFFGILVVAPRLQKVLYGGKKLPWLASMLIMSISTSLICAPILIYNFGSISLLSLVANLVILPTLPYVMLGMMLTGITSMLPVIANIMATITCWLLDLHIGLISFLSEQKSFIITLPSNDARFYLLYIPVLIFLLWPTIIKKACKRKIVKSKELPASSVP